jgi:hypothetical protein
MFVVKKTNKKDAGSEALKKGLLLVGYFGALRAMHFVATKYFDF